MDVQGDRDRGEERQWIEAQTCDELFQLKAWVHSNHLLNLCLHQEP